MIRHVMRHAGLLFALTIVTACAVVVALAVVIGP
jgi:hypothetical protein